jgi:hypothetical protein
MANEKDKNMLIILPISFATAKEYITNFHRHHKAPQGHKFSIGCYDNNRLCGVASVGRPVNRHMDDKLTAEIIRVCSDGTPNVCSKLYGACIQTSKGMGYRRVITYILESEHGSSVRASNMKFSHVTQGGKWVGKLKSGNMRKNEHPIEKKSCYMIIFNDYEKIKNIIEMEEGDE